MNREKEGQLPMMQVNFIDSICLPIYEVCINVNVNVYNVYCIECIENRDQQ